MSRDKGGNGIQEVVSSILIGSTKLLKHLRETDSSHIALNRTQVGIGRSRNTPSNFANSVFSMSQRSGAATTCTEPDPISRSGTRPRRQALFVHVAQVVFLNRAIGVELDR